MNGGRISDGIGCKTREPMTKDWRDVAVGSARLAADLGNAVEE
jgi:hypothetical protein